MPTYEYKCSNDKCNHQWEEDQSIKAPVIEQCPKCKKETAKRQISCGSFVLKGGGWYSEGYSSK